MAGEILNLTYSPAAQATWRTYYQEFFAHVKRFGSVIHPMYRDHMAVLEAFSEQIPTLSDLSRILAPHGWSARYVDGYAPPWKIARLIANQVMPISRSIRPPEEVFFAKEPDLIHDIFGHLPTLLDPRYRRLLLKWAQRASEEPVTEMDRTHYHLNKVIVQAQNGMDAPGFKQLQAASDAFAIFSRSNPSRLWTQDKIYFWIFEFGLIENVEGKQVFGAGLISSLSELAKIGAEEVATMPLTPRSFQADYNISSEQVTYLVAPSVEAYEDFLDEISPHAAPLKSKTSDGREAYHVHG
jgi:phenylalanine-4-hydroxylase